MVTAIVDLDKAPAFIRNPEALKSWVLKELSDKGMPLLSKPIRPAVTVEVWHDPENNKYFFNWETT